MPLKIEVIRATEFVRVGPEGHFDLPASKAALATVAAACRKRGIQHAIIDLRALHPGPKPVFTPADLVEMVNTFPEVGFTRRLRLAILYRSDPHKRARLFAFLSTLRGWNVRAFGDFEAALLWLSRSQETLAQPVRAAGAQAIPIRFRAPGTASPIRSVPAAGRAGKRAAGQKRPGPASGSDLKTAPAFRPVLARLNRRQPVL